MSRSARGSHRRRFRSAAGIASLLADALYAYGLLDEALQMTNETRGRGIHR